MLEIIRMLVEAILKLNPKAIEEFRREGKYRELGTQLFRLYNRLNDLTAQGQKLIETLRDMVAHKSLLNSRAELKEVYTERLQRDSQNHAQDVQRCADALVALREPLMAIDAQSAHVMEDLFMRKACLLECVRHALERGHVPPEDLISDKIDLSVFHKPAYTVGQDYFLMFDQASDDDLVGFDPLSAKVMRDSLPPLDQWSDEDYQRVEQYLKIADEQLARLLDVAPKLRTNLLNAFSLKDVLVGLWTE